MSYVLCGECGDWFFNVSLVTGREVVHKCPPKFRVWDDGDQEEEGEDWYQVVHGYDAETAVEKWAEEWDSGEDPSFEPGIQCWVQPDEGGEKVKYTVYAEAVLEYHASPVRVVAAHPAETALNAEEAAHLLDGTAEKV